MADGNPSSALDVALGYIRRGWSPIPIPHKEKRPKGNEWQQLRITAASASSYFNGHANIGVILGPASGDLVDVDLDCKESVILAPRILPPTAARFGRPGKPGSHFLYRCKVAHDKAAFQFKDPVKVNSVTTGKMMNETLCELRVGGVRSAQTVFPGSTHPSGERITWDEEGEPAEVEVADLLKRVRLLAVMALLARSAPGEGSREKIWQI